MNNRIAARRARSCHSVCACVLVATAAALQACPARVGQLCTVTDDCGFASVCTAGVCAAASPDPSDIVDAGLPGDDMNQRADAGTPNGDGALALEIGLVANTAYELRRSDANQCVDVPFSFAGDFDGLNGDLRQFSCNRTGAQVFWTDAGDGSGFFRLTNARNARCIVVNGADANAGANIVQRACVGGDEQLWRSEAQTDGFFVLRNKLTGKLFDTASPAFVGDGGIGGEPGDIQQGNADSAVHWVLQVTTASAFNALQSFDGLLTVAADDTRQFGLFFGAVEAGDKSAFRVIPGLGDAGGVSFASRAFPGRILRHRGGNAFVDVDDGAQLTHDDATFFLRGPPLAGAVDPAVSLVPKNFPENFLHNGAGVLRIDRSDGSATFPESATLLLVAR